MKRLACVTVLATALAAGSGHAETAFTLAGAAPAFSANTQVLGVANPSSIVHLQVALSLRNKAELEGRTAAGEQLTFDELSQRYLPTQGAHDAVVAWLTMQGLTIEQTHASRMTIGVSGTTFAAGKAFGVVFSRIRTDSVEWIATASSPSVPASLMGTILAVNGLQPQLHAVPQIIFAGAAQTRPPFYPSNFTAAYGVGIQGRKGAGTTTAIMIDTFPLQSDLQSFWTTTGVAQSLSNVTLIQVNPGTLNPPSGEETLDTEISSSMGSASKVRVYAAQNLAFTALDNDFQAVISDLKAGVKITQVSISLGACETAVGSAQANSDDQLFAVIQAMGASIFVSSGDSGSDACNTSGNSVSFYASSPNVTAVGGTSLFLNANGTRNSESGWSGGGGLSEIFTQPNYQTALKRYNRRASPDISADANPYTGTYMVLQGQATEIGGTSLSSPMCAGLFGLVNASRLAAGKASLGALNDRIYPLLGKRDLFDIKVGSNGGYSAAVGYDLVTGIGTPNLAKLLPALADEP